MSEQQRINKLKIVKLKGICDFEIDFVPNAVTGIFGVNCSGKSTILHCLACLYKPKQGSSRTNYKFSSFFKHDNRQNWNGSSLSMEYTHRENGKLVSKTYVVNKNKDRWTHDYGNRPDREVFYLGIDSCVPQIEKEKGVVTSYVLTGRHNIEKADEIAHYAAVVLNRQYQSVYEEKGKRYIYTTVDGRDQDDKALTYNTLNMGAGEQRLFKVLTMLLTAPNYSLILIDELDLTLHTAALNKLISVMNEIAARSKLQIVFTSHREELTKRTDINVRHIYSSNGKTFCLNNTTSECIDRLTGTSQRPLEVFVEDDLSERIVANALSAAKLLTRTNIYKFGSCENAFVVATGLYYAQKLNDNVLIVMDGDRYCSDEEKIARLEKVCTGNEEEAVARRNEIMSHIVQYHLPPGKNPEEYIHGALVECGQDTEIVKHAQSIKAVDDNHCYLYEIAEKLGEDKKIVYDRIVSEFIRFCPESCRSLLEKINPWIESKKGVI